MFYFACLKRVLNNWSRRSACNL